MKKKELEIEIIIPFGISLIKFHKVVRELALESLEQLTLLSGKIAFEVMGSKWPVTIDVSANSSFRRRFNRQWNSKWKSHFWDYKFIRLTARGEIDISPKSRKGFSVQAGKKKEWTAPVYVFVEEAGGEFEHVCRDLFLCVTIARPGVVRLAEGSLYINGKFYKTVAGICSSLDEAVRHVSEVIEWPTVKALSIEKVWAWFETIKDLKEGIGEGPVGRAVAALSYITCDSVFDGHDLDIVWALLGLEAVYCRGGSGVMSQLVEKCQLVLGPIEKRQRIIRQMYDLRSRVIHGNVDLPVQYSYYEGNPQHERFHSDIYKAALLAQVMLVVTLQYLVEHNLRELDFRYVLANTARE